MDEAYKQCVDLGKKGLAEAQYMLGRMYLSGRGVEKNITKAKSWFELAADGGNGDAQYTLAYFYLTGKESTKDFVMAYKWMNLAARNNIKDSAKIRDKIELSLTRQELAEAQKLTRTWSERKMSPWTPEEILAACPKS
jgi:TPR repeat protein